MIYSMTGFARRQVITPHFAFSVQLRSLNSKVLDINLKLPFVFRAREAEVRKILADILQLGKIDLHVRLENITATAHVFNFEIASWYYQQLLELEDQLQIKNPQRDWMQILLSLPDVFRLSEDEIPEEDFLTFMNELKDICNELMQYRLEEGKSLENDILQQLHFIEENYFSILSLSDKRLEIYKKKLLDELRMWKKQNDLEFDERRLEEQLIYYADKLDINEELKRLKHHLDYFKDVTMDEKNLLKGKKLTFIVQEMGREINTLGNKSNMFEIQQLVVEMKTALEKIKEQLSNVL
ncbi:MAG: YicC family protein [Bacteroidales bacterium]|nr:YicC family protein [Bacteroidales bacterium]